MTSSPEMDEIVREFVAETRENLQQFESSLLEAEKDEAPSGMKLATMFRSIHSIKGSCGFLGFAQLEAVAHAGESLLGALRERTLELDPRRVSALLAMVDDIRRIVDRIESDGMEPAIDVAATVAVLEGCAHASASRRAGESVADTMGSEDDWDGSAGTTAGGGKIRVDVELLDRLMNLVGELVLARNQVLQGGTTGTLAGAAPIHRLNQVTTELQEAVVKTRMQPIGNVWARFPRVVRELSVATGKKVRLVLDGRETELDKSVLEAIQDPLTHLVRNAVDHGIETPASRAGAGKPEEGRLQLRAFHDGGMVNIEVLDDGAGIDPQRIRGRAVHLGLRTPDQVARLGDREALRLLFLPGFSTADTVTRVSGRGVGMDVVRANVEGIGGAIDIESGVGSGTCFRIKIPLTLAIIPALVVESDGARYAIPQSSVVEVVRVDAEQVSRSLERVHGAPVLRLRGKLLPLAFLRSELGSAPRDSADGSVSIVVLRADERSFGLVVDEIRDTEEIVVKPMWKRLKHLGLYAGATVMGDGRVALILDSVGMGQRIGVLADSRSATLAEAEVERPTAESEAQENALLCRLGSAGRLAIPLDAVARLEELPVDRIERIGGLRVAQYRGEILGLVPATQVLEERRSSPRDGDASFADAERETASVVVLDCEPPVGLVVEGILDIVSYPASARSRATRAGVVGTVVVHDRITEILDVEHALRVAGSRRSSPHLPGTVEVAGEANP